MTGDRAVELAVRKINYRYRCGIAVLDERRDGLRDISINPERGQRRQRDDWNAGRRRWRRRLRNQGPWIGVARGYDSVEGRPHYFVSLESELLLVGRFCLQHRGVRLVGRLLRNDLLLNQFLVAGVGNFLNPIERTGVSYLLVRLGRFDQCDNFAGLDVVALVDVDGLHVASDLGVDRSLDVAVDAGRELDRSRRTAA